MPRGRPWTLPLLLEMKHVTPSGCWEWTGYRDSSGYGCTWMQGRPERAHRLSWRLHYGDVTDNRDVCHRCDNPPCFRPDHLFLGTVNDNLRDMVSKGRHSRARLTPTQVAIARKRLARGDTHVSIARAFGVSDGVIDSIAQGRTWLKPGQERPPRRPQLTPQAVLDIRAAIASGENTQCIADRYGICRSYVYRIKLRRKWAWL